MESSPSSVSKSVKQSSEPLLVISSSPFRVKIMDLSSMLIMQPTTSPFFQGCPKYRLPACIRRPLGRKNKEDFRLGHITCGKDGKTILLLQRRSLFTLYPSKTKAWSSAPSSTSGLQAGLAHPTLISPPLRASNSKYHFPVFTAYVCSTRNRRMVSMLSSAPTWAPGVWEKHEEDGCHNRDFELKINKVRRERLVCLQNVLTLLVWGVDVISIANHGPDGLSQTVSVRLFCALIQ